MKLWTARISPGEYYVTRGGEAVTTVLGSCIAACVRDVRTGAGGMNHFMLPENGPTVAHAWDEFDGTPSNRFGVNAMKSLLDAVANLGARHDDLELKFFGGARILLSMNDIGARNIAFARRFAADERLRVIAEDVGGVFPRHVIFSPASGVVLVRRLQALDVLSIDAPADLPG